MSNREDSETAMVAPRPLGVLAVQVLLGLPFLLPGIIMALFGALLVGSGNMAGLLMGLPLMVGLLLIYIPQRRIPRLVINKGANRLMIEKKGRVVQEVDLIAVKHIKTKVICDYPTREFKLLLESGPGQTVPLFQAFIPYGGRRWKLFALRLARETGKPIETEFWAKDCSGKLSLVTPAELGVGMRKKALAIGVPIGVALTFAATVRLFPAKEAYFIIGGVSVLVNLLISFLYVLKHRRDPGEWESHTAIIIGGVLTLSIPYAFYYVLFAFVIMGFRVPLGN